jgi:predicted glycoside hydrolase/deacetylase ChbG (UPF0249 family)
VRRASGGLLIINADDWGRDYQNTECALACFKAGAITSVSGMVFMEDSERAAAISNERRIDSALHLNLTTPFSAANAPERLAEHQQRTARFLGRNRMAQTVYHPGLMDSFEYVVKAQLDEFRRVYGMEPRRIDGHHHMHLCANVLFGGLLPDGTAVRRNFTFSQGEKSLVNRLYRSLLDRMLARRHRLTDFFFSLPPLQPVERIEHIFAVAACSVVEVEAHPVRQNEYEFLMSDDFRRLTATLRLASFESLCHQ